MLRVYHILYFIVGNRETSGSTDVISKYLQEMKKVKKLMFILKVESLDQKEQCI